MNLTRIENIRNEWLDPIEPPQDTRPQCKRCGERFEPASSEQDEYCSAAHWHLSQPGQEVQNQIDLWIRQGCTEKVILRKMALYWFWWMTESTVNRWKRVIRLKVDMAAELNEC